MYFIAFSLHGRHPSVLFIEDVDASRPLRTSFRHQTTPARPTAQSGTAAAWIGVRRDLPERHAPCQTC
jgi:hypothetical protein